MKLNNKDYIYSDLLNANLFSKINYIKEGCKVAENSPNNMNVIINSGIVIFGENKINVSGGSLLLTSTINGFYKHALIRVNNEGVLSVIYGSEDKTNGIKPNKPLNIPDYEPETHIVLARILISNKGFINNSDITDLRKIRIEELPYSQGDIKITTNELGEGWGLINTKEVKEIVESWDTKTTLPTARESLTSSVVNDKIYCIGGYTDSGTYLNKNEEYNPSTNTWTTKANMPTARTALTSSVVNDKIYCIGGAGGINKNEEYNPSTNTWTTKANMPTGRFELTSSVVNDKIYCIGGAGGINKNEEYNPSTNTWTTKANMPTGRYHLTSSNVNNKIYCIGGYTDSGTYLNKNEEYNPSTNTWTTKANMPTARERLTSSVVNDKIYCIGGFTGSYSNKNEEYNPSTDTWTTKANMPTARNALTSSVVNDKIYCIGGFTGSYSNKNEEYTPKSEEIKYLINYYIKE